MNKQNECHNNEASTAIHEQISKSNTYSSKFLQSLKRPSHQNTQTTQQKKLLPSKYQKYVVKIQRWWRFRMYMKREVCKRVMQDLSDMNECYLLENRVLQRLIQQYENVVRFKENCMERKIKKICQSVQQETKQIKKQCVMTTFRLQKKTPSKEMLQSLIIQKQQSKQISLELKRQLFLSEQQLQKQKRTNSQLMHQLKTLTMAHLQLVKEKNELSHSFKEKFLETSKFGSRKKQLNDKLITGKQRRNNDTK